MNLLLKTPVLCRQHPYLALNLFLLILMGFFFRGVALDRLPALNGDEAYTSVQMAEFARGQKVDLYLPTHRTLSPLYGLYVWSVEKLLPGHDFWKIRLPALLAGILLVFFAFIFLRWVLPTPIALFASILIACSPVNIAYSRSAVEQCLMGLASFFPLYFALEGSFFSAFAALAIGVVIHPVNIFLLPITFFPFCAKFFHSPDSRLRFKIPFLIGTVLLSAAFIFLLLRFLPAQLGWLNIQRVLHFLWFSPLGFLGSGLEFLLYFVRLYSGFSTDAYFSAAPPEFLQFLWDMGMALIFVSSLLGLHRLKKLRRWREFYFILGFFCMLFFFFLVAGPRTLSVGLSRQGNFLIVPTSIALAILIPETLSGLRFRSLLIGFLGLGWIFLLHFYLFYFQSTIRTGGGSTHRTYISGPVEPKASALQWVVERSGGKAKILAEDWWIYWPVKYLALSHPDIEVILLAKKTDAETFDQLFIQGAYAMGFPNGPIDTHLLNRYKNSLKSLVVFIPPSYAKDRALKTWQSIRTPP